MLPSEYNAKLGEFHHKIMDLPTSDLKYHLYLLLFSIVDVNTEYTRDVLECAIDFTDCYHNLLQKSDDEELIQQLYYLNIRFDTLATTAGTNTNWVILKQAILNIGGSFAGFACGIVGGIIGGVSGFARGLWNQEAYGEYTWTGAVIGLCIGSAIGFRSPKKLLKDPMFRQVKVALDGLDGAVVGTTNAYEDLGLNTYHDEAYKILLRDYFDNDVYKLEEYLESDEVEYEIASHGAEFVSPRLAGSVGHHVFIRISINDKYLGIEFTPSPSDFNKTPIQSEIRKVNGEKILEMLTFHLALQKTDALNYTYIVTKLKSGDRDCMSYINKLLIGTSQDPTILSRFHETDKLAGYLVSFFMRPLSPYPDNLQLYYEEVGDSAPTMS